MSMGYSNLTRVLEIWSRMIKSYIEIMKSKIQRGLVYQSDVIFQLAGSILSLFIQVMIWQALYKGKIEVAGITLTEMITYVVVVRIAGIATSMHGAEEIESKMKSGDICLDLIQPVNYRIRLFFENLGLAVQRLMLEGLPIVFIGIIFFKINPPASLMHFIGFLMSFFGAFVVVVAIELVMGTTAFWFMNVWFLGWAYTAFSTVFSGRAVPLWFFPDVLKKVGYLLPFRVTQFVPASLYLGKISVDQIPWVLLQQLMWAVGLLAFHCFIWNKGIKRITVHGG